MAQYRKKPVVIEAWQTYVEGASTMPDWLRDAIPDRIRYVPGNPGVYEIKTLEGVMTADARDWIIRGVKGEIYPCKPDIFEATYEAVKQPT